MDRFTDPINRGMVGGLLGVPAELGAMFLNGGRSIGNLANRLAGVNAPPAPMVENPVYGQEWWGNKMQQAGLVSPQRNKLAEFGAGLLDPSGVAKAPLLAKGLFALGDPATTKMLGGLLGATVWHGSPHKFDKFDTSAPKTTGGNFNTYGVSVSDDQNVAQRYAEDFGGADGQLYKVDADIANPLELSARDFHSLQRLTGEVDHAAKSGLPISESNSVSLEQILKNNGIQWNWQQGEHPIDAIKRAGHDAIKGAGYSTRSGHAEQETLIFDADRLKILERNGKPVK